jgi:hypothetical protein
MEYLVFDSTDPACVIWRGVTQSNVIPELIEETIYSNYRHVRVSSNTGPTWKEFALSPTQKLWSILCQQFVLDEVEARTGGRLINERIAWLNVYGQGQHIDWHRDGVGDMQIILVLDAPCVPEGQLMLRTRENEQVVPLYIGDAILFSARRVFHRTTPIVTPGLRRVTAVMRFFVSGQVTCSVAQS